MLPLILFQIITFLRPNGGASTILAPTDASSGISQRIAIDWTGPTITVYTLGALHGVAYAPIVGESRNTKAKTVTGALGTYNAQRGSLNQQPVNYAF